jgi:hypothetical protein
MTHRTWAAPTFSGTSRRFFIAVSAEPPNAFFCSASVNHFLISVCTTTSSRLDDLSNDHLRQAKFAGLRDKDPRKVIKEHPGVSQA